MAAMDAFASKSADLVLTGEPESRTYRQRVANLTVRSNSQNVRAVSGASSGFIEFYTCRYSPRTMATPSGGAAEKYDFKDTPQPQKTLGYGCLQIHDLAEKRTVLAFNHFNAANKLCDVGIGTNPDVRGNPDWTFAANAGKYKARCISGWVR